MRIPLAKQAVAETGMGVVEDKVIKNHYAAEYIYNAYKDSKTCGVIEEDTAYGIQRIAEPIGVIAAVIPTTNPTSTAIFKTLISLKTRNGIIISPHPRAKGCTIAAARVVLEAAVAAGAPEGIIAWIDKPSLELTNQVMREADLILAIGGGSAMDAGKIMWVLYEHPEADFLDMAMRFVDIRKRVYTFPKMGEKAYFVAIPTSAGTGSEVTPFAVITDESTGVKYPLADYELLPKMAIVDADMMMNAPRGLTAASGIDAVTHALEAYASVMATDYTDGLALRSLKLIFANLPAAYEQGAKAPRARENMANAATMAGMAFANAFLGVCHSMAHKLGAFHHLPHGIANALLIRQVLRFNAAEVPAKMGTFSQYDHPHTLARYAEVADYLKLGGTTDEEKLQNLIDAITELMHKVGIHDTIREYGIREEDFLSRLDEMVEQAFDDQCTGANPRYPLMKEIKEMYLNAYYGE